MAVGCGSGRATHEKVKRRSLPEYRIFETEQLARDLKRIARSGHEDTVRTLRPVVCPQLTRPLMLARTSASSERCPRNLAVSHRRLAVLLLLRDCRRQARAVFMITATHRGLAYSWPRLGGRRTPTRGG